jgi:AcrR family transcriptional regulator
MVACDMSEKHKNLATRTVAEDLPWKPWEDRQAERDVKRQAVLRVAARLFLERGWNGATMQELGERLNITKPALYNCFLSKEDVLRHCILINNEKTANAFAAAEAHSGKGIDRLRLFLQLYAAVSTSETGACVNRIDDRELDQELREEFTSIKRTIDLRARALVAAGIKDGSIAPCDVRMTTFVLMGAVQSISRWYRSDGVLTSDEIAREISIRLISGLTTAGTSSR